MRGPSRRLRNVILNSEPTIRDDAAALTRAGRLILVTWDSSSRRSFGFWKFAARRSLSNSRTI